MIHRFTVSKTAFLLQRKAVSLIEKGRFALSLLKVHIHSNREPTVVAGSREKGLKWIIITDPSFLEFSSYLERCQFFEP